MIRERWCRLGCVLLLLPLVACAASGSGSGGAPLVMARVKDAVGLDPAHQDTTISLDTTAEVFETLVAFKPGSFTLVPDLARSWSVDRSGTRWTFVLRRGARFTDGTPADAAAVKFNVDRWRLVNDPQHGNYPYAYYGSMFGGFPGVIRDVRVAAADRVTFVLAHPFGPFLRNMAMAGFGIGSPAAISADPKAFERKPVASGPYTVSEWVADDHITLTANPAYNGPRRKPTFQTVIIRDIPDQATSVLSMEKGDVQMLTDVRADDAKALAAQPGIAVVDQPPNNIGYLALNVTRPPFDRLLVRRAIANALDTPAIAKALYPPGTIAAANWTPPGIMGEDPALRPYPHDVARARALLARAGFPHGFATELYYPTTPRPYMPEPQRLAETVQAQLKEAGISITLQPFEFGVFLAKVSRGEHPMCLIGWTGSNGDPDNFLYPLLDADSAHVGSAENYSFWRDPRFHALMLAGQNTNDQAQRARIYQQANALVHDQVPAIPIVHTVVPLAISRAVGGFVPSPDTHYHFELIVPAAGGR